MSEFSYCALLRALQPELATSAASEASDTAISLLCGEIELVSKLELLPQSDGVRVESFERSRGFSCTLLRLFRLELRRCVVPKDDAPVPAKEVAFLFE